MENLYYKTTIIIFFCCCVCNFTATLNGVVVAEIFFFFSFSLFKLLFLFLELEPYLWKCGYMHIEEPSCWHPPKTIVYNGQKEEKIELLAGKKLKEKREKNVWLNRFHEYINLLLSFFAILFCMCATRFGCFFIAIR